MLARVSPTEARASAAPAISVKGYFVYVALAALDLPCLYVVSSDLRPTPDHVLVKILARSVKRNADPC